jgi:hypothetical protein
MFGRGMRKGDATAECGNHANREAKPLTRIAENEVLNSCPFVKFVSVPGSRFASGDFAKL